MAEMNRRTLAFRGGGLSAAAVNNNNNNGVSSEEEAPAWSLGRQLNGGGAAADEEEVEVELEPEGLLEDDEEEGEAYPGAVRPKAAAGAVTGPSVSGDSSEEDEDDEEEEDEDGAGGKAVGDEDCALIQGDGPRRYGLLSSARSQSLLPSLHCSFQGSWLHEFPWLRFCQETGLMSCAWCHGNDQAGHDELTKGTRNYKRALLVRHSQAAEHRLNDPTVQVRRTSSPSVAC